MISMLQRKGHSKSAAEKLAQRHIKGTMDLAHANIWQKYYNPEEGEDAEKGFRKW